MSHRPGANKRKGNEDALWVDDDELEERKEDKRPRPEPVAAAAASSSSAAAAAPSSSAAAASSSVPAAPSAASAAASSSRPPAELEKLVCVQCKDAFECDDASGLLPRNLPCGHVLCSTCIKGHLNRTHGFVVCPEGEGPQQIGTPAAAASTMDGWLRKLQPAKDLIAAIKNQQTLLTRIGQQGVRCSRPGCESAVTHYCSKCLDLCGEHERSRHAALPSHKAATMLIAQKESFLRGQSQSEVAKAASAIRFRVGAPLKQQQLQTERTEAELKKAQAQVQAKKRELHTNAQALNVLQHTMDQMRSADDDTVIEMNEELPPIAAAWTKHDSTVLNSLSDDRVADLQSFLGPARLLSKAKLIYRASRDGFKAEDWWRLCGGESNTLTLIKVTGNGFVFGAFSAFQWPAGVPTHYASIADPTGSTSLFSLVNAHGRAVKMRLKESQKATAGQACLTGGPIFGDDLVFMDVGNSADTPDGNWISPTKFEFDSVADGGKPIKYDKTLFAEDDGKRTRLAYFAAAEIETWQL